MTSWRDRALCRTYPHPEIFFPEAGRNPRAKLICDVCPVASECLEESLIQGDRYGVWGGHSAQERRRMMRERGLTRRLAGEYDEVIVDRIWAGQGTELVPSKSEVRELLARAERAGLDLLGFAERIGRQYSTVYNWRRWHAAK